MSVASYPERRALKPRSRLATVVLLAILALPALASAQLKTVRVATAHKLTTANLPLFVGMHMKFFEEVGIKLEPSYFRGGGEVIRALTTRSTDVTHNAATAAAFIAISKGESMKIVSGNSTSLSMVWVVEADSPLKSVKDLRGKKVAFSTPGSITHVIIQFILKQEGLDKEVQLVRTGGPGDTWTAVKTKIVDVGWAVSPGVYDLIRRNEARIVIDPREYVKNYQETVILAMADTINKEPEMIRNYLKARAKAISFLWENPERALAIWAEEVKLPVEALRLAYKDTPRTYWDVGPPRMENLQAALQEALEVGAIKQPLDLAKVLDLRFLPSVP
jgi:NitT/TauT family transport system substrate-binding protein